MPLPFALRAPREQSWSIPALDGGFTAEEKSLVSVIAGFGAVALAHAELCSTAQGQARELHQLLEISSELSSSGDLDHFLQAFVVRASDFLGFGRCFIALLEDEQFHVRHSVTRGQSQRVDNIFPEGIATRALRAKEVFCSNDLSEEAGVNLPVVTRYKARQLLAVPLLSADGSVLGMFGVLDRLDDTGISREDIRRARALAAQVSVVLEVARNLHQSELNRRRSDVLIQLAREIDGLLRLPDFARKFVDRAVELTGARAGALALFQDGRFQTAALHPLPASPRAITRRDGAARTASQSRRFPLKTTQFRITRITIRFPTITRFIISPVRSALLTLLPISSKSETRRTIRHCNSASRGHWPSW